MNKKNKNIKINKESMINTPYYLEIYDSNHKKFITIFTLYDFNKKIFFYGDRKIKNEYNYFDDTKISINNKIPISKLQFDIFLELWFPFLQETNKNIFLSLNGLEEWII